MIRTGPLLCIIALSISVARAADPWNINENFAGFSIAEASWTIDESFPGTKLIFDGSYAIRQETVPARERNCVCEPLPDPDRIGYRYPHQVSGGQLQRAGVLCSHAPGQTDQTPGLRAPRHDMPAPDCRATCPD